MKNLRFVEKRISLCHHKANPLPIPHNHASPSHSVIIKYVNAPLVVLISDNFIIT